MTEYFRIEGLHTIDYDLGATPTGRYRLTVNRPPTGLSKPLTRQEVLMNLARLPQGVRGHALNRGMSVVTITMNIQGSTDADMEDAEHDLNETLVDAALYIETQGARGTRPVLRVKADGAVMNSYKTIYHGILNEASGRDTLGAKIKEHLHSNLILTLYCEPHWRPETAITLGPNEIYCPSFEEDGDDNGRADDWATINVPTLTIEDTIVLHGCHSQKVVTRNLIGDGIQSTIAVAPGGVTSAVCYAWIARPAAPPSDIIVELYDSTAPAVRGSALYDTGGWDEAEAKDGVTTFYRIEVPVAAGIVPGNNHRMRIRNTQDTATTFYVDKCYWKWDTVVIPDEWCDHWLIYNHYDTDEGHQNYYDVDGLKGDVDARLLMRTEFEKIADEDYARHLTVARRTRLPCSYGHWLEGENHGANLQWAILGGLARCSAGDCVSNAVNVTGWIRYSLGLAAPRDIVRWLGKHDLFVVVYTDDPVNTQYRISWRWGTFGPQVDGSWTKQTATSKWQLLRLGSIDWDVFFRTPILPQYVNLEIHYEKDAADTVRLDCIWLVPKDEPQMRLEVLTGGWVIISNLWAVGRDEDFDYIGREDPAWWRHRLVRHGEAMGLCPRKENRLYFVCETLDSPDDIYEAHRIAGPANALEMVVNIDYLPQYISPLE